MTPTYHSWVNMLRRCRDTNNHRFPQYGGRGITVCDRWLIFDNFLADMGEKPAGLTLERVDVNGSYSPENCCWATLKEQANNKTSNRILEWQGRSMTTAQWSDFLGIPHATLRMRLHRNWPVERVLSQAPRSTGNV